MMRAMNFTRTKRRWLAWCCRWVAVIALAITPATAMAQQGSDEHDVYDARLEAYAGN